MAQIPFPSVFVSRGMGNQTSRNERKPSGDGSKKNKRSGGDLRRNFEGDAPTPGPSRGGNELGIPGNSPLARLLLHWASVKVQDFQTEQEMVRMCTEVWPQFNITPKWPQFGSNNFDDIKLVDDFYVSHPPRSVYVDSWFWYLIKFGEGVRLAVSRNLVESKLTGEEMSKFDPLEFINYQPPPPPPPVQQQQQVPTAPPLNAPETETPQIYPALQPPTYDQTLREGQLEGAVGEESVGPISPISSDRTVDYSTSPPPRPNTRSRSRMLELGEGSSGVFQCPLREVPMGSAVGFVEVPLTNSDIRIIKQNLPSLPEDPIGFVTGLRDALGTMIYKPTELLHICRQLAGATYTNQALEQARQLWRGQAAGAARTEDQARERFPELTPGDWDFQNPNTREQCAEMMQLLLKGFEAIIPKTVSMKLAFGQPQGKDETPVEYLERLKRNMRRYTGLDPDDPANLNLLRLEFVSGCYPDIRMKLQKFDNLTTKPMSELLTEAQKVVARREDEKEKRKLKLMTQMVEKVVERKVPGNGPSWERPRGRGFGRGDRGGYRNQGSRGGYARGRGRDGDGKNQVGGPRRTPLPHDVCANCGQVGHWKRECRNARRNDQEELTRLAACYEDE